MRLRCSIVLTCKALCYGLFKTIDTGTANRTAIIDTVKHFYSIWFASHPHPKQFTDYHFIPEEKPPNYDYMDGSFIGTAIFVNVYANRKLHVRFFHSSHVQQHTNYHAKNIHLNSNIELVIFFLQIFVAIQMQMHK